MSSGFEETYQRMLRGKRVLKTTLAQREYQRQYRARQRKVRRAPESSPLRTAPPVGGNTKSKPSNARKVNHE